MNSVDHQKRCIQFLSDCMKSRMPVVLGYQKAQRQVCPHLLGKTKDGRIVLQGFQFGGGTSKGPIASPEQGQWRYFYLDEISFAATNTDLTSWYPAEVKKSEKQSTFIVEVLAAVAS